MHKFQWFFLTWFALSGAAYSVGDLSYDCEQLSGTTDVMLIHGYADEPYFDDLYMYIRSNKAYTTCLSTVRSATYYNYLYEQQGQLDLKFTLEAFMTDIDTIAHDIQIRFPLTTHIFLYTFRYTGFVAYEYLYYSVTNPGTLFEFSGYIFDAPIISPQFMSPTFVGATATQLQILKQWFGEGADNFWFDAVWATQIYNQTRLQLIKEASPRGIDEAVDYFDEQRYKTLYPASFRQIIYHELYFLDYSLAYVRNTLKNTDTVNVPATLFLTGLVDFFTPTEDVCAMSKRMLLNQRLVELHTYMAGQYIMMEATDSVLLDLWIFVQGLKPDPGYGKRYIYDVPCSLMARRAAAARVIEAAPTMSPTTSSSPTTAMPAAPVSAASSIHWRPILTFAFLLMAAWMQ